QGQPGAMEDRIRGAKADAAALADRAFAGGAGRPERPRAGAGQGPTRRLGAAQPRVSQEAHRDGAAPRAEGGTAAPQPAERRIPRSLTDEDHQRILREALARVESA